MLFRCVFLTISALLHVDSLVFSNSSASTSSSPITNSSTINAANRTTVSVANSTVPPVPLNSTTVAQIWSNSTVVNSTQAPSTSPHPPRHPWQKKPALFNCFIDERFLREVQTYFTIGIRASDDVFKISGPDESFRFNFFYSDPVMSLLNGYSSTDAPDTTPDYNNGNATIALFGNSTNVTFISNTTVLTNTSSPLGNLSTPIPTMVIPGVSTPYDKFTVAYDFKNQDFHFIRILSDRFQHFRINRYKEDGLILDERSLSRYQPTSSSVINMSEPFTCHYNVFQSSTMCVSIKNKLVTVGYFTRNATERVNRFSLPNYLSFDKFHSYSDSEGSDYILLHHKSQWIYRINYQQYLTNQNMFFKVFHLKTPGGDYEFMDFMHADEFGLVTQYHKPPASYRYFYSLFSEVSGLKTYCVHDKLINGSLVLLGRKRPEPQKGVAAALRDMLDASKSEADDFPVMQRILFYCTLIYLSIFFGIQMVPGRKVQLSRELRRIEKEVQRLAPVIETIITKVHLFMENMKKEQLQEGHKVD